MRGRNRYTPVLATSWRSDAAQQALFIYGVWVDLREFELRRHNLLHDRGKRRLNWEPELAPRVESALQWSNG